MDGGIGLVINPDVPIVKMCTNHLDGTQRSDVARLILDPGVNGLALLRTDKS